MSSNETCAACAGGPSEGKFAIKQVKSNRITVMNISMSMPKMGHYDGVSICGGCLATALNENGLSAKAPADKPAARAPEQPAAQETPAASSDEPEDPFFSAVADAVAKLHADRFDPLALSSAHVAPIMRSA